MINLFNIWKHVDIYKLRVIAKIINMLMRFLHEYVPDKRVTDRDILQRIWGAVPLSVPWL